MHLALPSKEREEKGCGIRQEADSMRERVHVAEDQARDADETRRRLSREQQD